MARPSRAPYYRYAMLGVVVLGGAWGCAVVAGVDFDAARQADPDEAGGAANDGAGPTVGGGDAGTPTSDAAAVTCGADQKVCSGGCVVKTNPDFGCGQPACTPCSLALATGAQCGADGGCVPKGCAAGFDDCDGDPSNGCEADLSRPETCGSCKTKCGANELCTPQGCGSSCAPGLVACNGSCVDTKTNAAHCGGCNKACTAGANADPVCVKSACQIACRSGFADCAHTPPQSCVPLPKWFADGDGDGFGNDKVVTTGCTAPNGFVQVGGDCLDTNPSVHPGAAAAAVPFAGANGPSFDYDCSGVEEEQGSPSHWSGTCGATCNENGSIPLTPPRAGTGVDNYCGSPNRHICFDLSGLGSGCNSVDYDAGTPVACK